MAFSYEKKIHLNIEKLNDLIKEKISGALEAGGALIEADAKHNCRVDQGHLRASIHFKLEKWNILRVGSSLSYAAPVELGSMPHTPPFEPIEEWAKRHGIEEHAWAIWQKIRTEGTQPHPYLRPAIHQNESVIMYLLKQAMDEAARESKK